MTSTSNSWFSFSYDQILLALSPTHAIYNWYAKPSDSEIELPPKAPAIAPSAFGLSIISIVRSFIWNDEMIQKGYDEHKNGLFRMPFSGQWATIATGQYINEMARAPDSLLSFQESVNQMLELESLAGPALSQDMVHLSVIKTLNRHLDAVYLEILDETKYGFDKIFTPIEADSDGWIKFRALETFLRLTSNLNHRSFIGLPLCRDDEWNKTQERTSVDLMVRSVFLKAFPKDANGYMSKYGVSFAKGVKMLSAVVEERRAMLPEDRPNDMLTWIMSHIQGTDEASLNDIMVTFNLVDLVAQNTTVSTFVHALYHLAASPQYINELREEVMDLTSTGDWTKNAIDRMRKLDSFVRETQRISGIQNVAMVRVAMQDFYFSNGVRVPKGEMVMAVGNPLHRDPEVYPDPYEFKPFRSLERVEAEGLSKSSHKYDMVTPSAEFMAWGLGKHACPGRFYASMVVKHLLAYILVYYEFKFSDETAKAAIKANKSKVPLGDSGEDVENARPQDFLLGGMHFPNTKAEMMFRKRKEEETMGSIFVYSRHA